MRAVRPILIAVTLAIALVLANVAYAANVAQDGLVKFYTEKESYLPNSNITIVAEFSSPFTGTYVLQIIGPNGNIVDAKVGNVENTTRIEYVFVHNEQVYGYGVFKATFSYSGYIITNGQKQNVYSSKPLEITFTIAPSYSIKGKVVDEAGNPVANAYVYVVEANTKVETSDDGSFIIAVKNPGTYTIIVSKPDYMSNSTVVKVEKLGVTDIGTIRIVSQAYMINQILASQKDLTEKLNELDSKLADLKTKYEALSNSLNDLVEKVNTNADRLAALSSTLDSLKNEIEDLRSSIDELRSILSEYATKNYVDTKIATEVQNIVNSLTAKINDIAKRVDEIKASLDKYATKDYVDSKIGDTENKLTSQLQSEVKKLSNEITEIKKDLSNLKSTVIQQLSQDLRKATDNANKASNIALAAVILAIIGIIIAIVVAIRLMRQIA